MRKYALSLGLKGLKQHIRRNIGTGCAIGISYIAILAIVGYSVRIDKYLSTATIYLQESGHVAVFKKGGLRGKMVKPRHFSLDPTEVAAINAFAAQQPSFEFSAPYLISGGLIGNGCKSFPFVGRGTNPKSQERIFNHDAVRTNIPEFRSILRGKALWESADLNQVALAKGLSKRMGKGLRDAVGKDVVFLSTADCASAKVKQLLEKDASVQLLGRTFDGVNGALDADFTAEYSTGLSLTEDNSLQLPLALMQDLNQTDKLSYMAVFLKDRNDSARFAEALTAAMKSQGITIDAYPYNDIRLNPNFVQGQAAMTFAVFFVSAIVVGVALLSILNTLSIGLAESRREIGTLLAIGFNPIEVAWIFTVETTATTLIALLLGIAGTVGLCEWITYLAIPLKAPGFSHASTFQFTPTHFNYFFVAICLCLLASVSTFLMARRFASRDILLLLDRGA